MDIILAYKIRLGLYVVFLPIALYISGYYINKVFNDE